MADCKVTTLIPESSFLGDSLFVINTNYYNVDSSICQLGKEVQNFKDFVNSLLAKSTSTINLYFSPVSYSLSGDVRDNSISTTKLGVNIPTTTKQFLTAAKISSLIDTNINLQTVQLRQGIRWDGSKWINSTMADEEGVANLYELKDVTIANNVKGGDVLKYNLATNKWTNVPDYTLSAIPDGVYADITVSNNGKNWNINPETITGIKLADNAVQTENFANSTITNIKFRPETIQLNRVAFANQIGEVNTARNIGVGRSISLEINQQTKIPFKRIKGVGCTINSTNETVTILAGRPPDPSAPVGINQPSSGQPIFIDVVVPQNVYRFKTLKDGDGIVLQQNNEEIIINKSQSYTKETTDDPILPKLGFSLLGIKQDGTAMTDAEVITRINQIFTPDRFPVNSTCKVNVESLTTVLQNSTPVSIPFTTKYVWNYTARTVVFYAQEHYGGTYKKDGKVKSYWVCCRSNRKTRTDISRFFQWTDPSATAIATNTYSGSKNLQTNTFGLSGTANITARVLTLTNIGGTWKL